MLGQEGKLFLDLVKQAVRCTRVIRRDIQLDIDQVFFRLRRPSDNRHAFPILLAAGYSACSKRRLASALIACMFARVPGPLSSPSCHKRRNSSRSF